MLRYLINSCSTLRRFNRDESGISLLYVTMSLPVIIGFGLLAIDVGRLTSLQSSLQHGADSLALAGAAELDLRPDSISRSEYALTNLVTTNTSLFATSVVTINRAAVTTCYLATLPANDVTPINSADCLDPAVAASNSVARFVQVIVTPVNFNTVFPATFVGAANNTATSGAEAVAGFQEAVCNFTPMFFCNPFEPATGTTNALTDYGLYDAASTVAYRRRTIAMKDHGTQWAPGNYGFLQTPLGPGAHNLGEMIADVSPKACFILDGLNTQPGNMTSLSKAFNTRFDMYDGSFSKQSYPPAANVRKGHIVKKLSGKGNANSCNDNNPLGKVIDGIFVPNFVGATLDDAMGLPQDSVIGSNRLGNGDWGGDTAKNNKVPDFEQYWATNHPDDQVPRDSDGAAYSNTNLPTRYNIYRYEIDNDLVGVPSLGYLDAEGTLYQETGESVCSTPGVTTPDRRIIYSAILNCRAVGMSGGAGGPYQALAFGKFFMTEPMGGPPDSVLYTELVDIIRPGRTDSVARDIVQLYR